MEAKARQKIFEKVLSHPSEVIESIDELSRVSLPDGDKAWLQDELTLAYIVHTNENQTEGREHLDTFQFLSLRNYIVEHLVKQQPEIDKLVSNGLAGRQITGPQRKHFRNWLDVAIKMTNVANRVQASTKLEVPQLSNSATFSSRNLARLVYGDDGLFERLFVADKVGKDTKPVMIPLGKTLSFYLGSWLAIFEPSAYVFENKNRSLWNASKEITDFLAKIFPLHKWLVGKQSDLRVIGGSTMAVFTHFDRRSMDLMGLLSRHTVNVIEKDYLLWSRLGRKRKLVVPWIAKLTLLRVPDELVKTVSVFMDKTFAIPNIQRTVTHNFELESLRPVRTVVAALPKLPSPLNIPHNISHCPDASVVIL